MMTSILSFCLKSMICSGVLAAYYQLVLKRAQFHTFNRAYLLMAVLLSLLLPFTRFQLFHTAPIAVPDFPLLAISGQGMEATAGNTKAVSSFNWQAVFTTIYCAVGFVILLNVVIKSLLVYSVKRKGKVIKKNGFLLIKTADPRAPFSFMNLLFWPVHMRQDNPEGKGIFMHELAHIRQGHTIDKFFMQLALAACWLNPFLWMIKKELWLQHEFLADKDAVKDRDGETFARMLLYGATNQRDNSLISSFYQSPVKRRLAMLTGKTKDSYAALRRFMGIPVLLLAVFLVSADTKHDANVVRAEKQIVLVLDAAHGGENHGGKSIYGPLEKDITLALCKKMAMIAGEYNVKVITTRNEDVHYSMQERMDIINGTDDAIFISMHVNKTGANSARNDNYELGVNPKSSSYKNGILLASAIAGRLNIQKLPARVVDGSKAHVMRENRHPAILMECGNLDDADNIALLNDEARREVLCRNILSGIVDYSKKL